MGLEGKTAIVTGASSGIGAATARALAEAGAKVAGGARRVDELETEVKLELDVTDPGELRAFRGRRAGSAGRARHPRQQRRPRPRPRPLRQEQRGGRGDRARDERARRPADDAPLPAAHPRRWPHREHGLDRRAPAVRERGRLHHLEVRRARLLVRAPRGPARPPDPHHDRRARPRRVELLARPLPRRRGEGERRLRGRRAAHARRRRGVRRLGGHPAAAREHRRARDQGARPVDARSHQSETPEWP